MPELVRNGQTDHMIVVKCLLYVVKLIYTCFVLVHECHFIIIIIINVNFTAIWQEIMLLMEMRKVMRVVNKADSIQPINGVAGMYRNIKAWRDE